MLSKGWFPKTQHWKENQQQNGKACHIAPPGFSFVVFLRNFVAVISNHLTTSCEPVLRWLDEEECITFQSPVLFFIISRSIIYILI